MKIFKFIDLLLQTIIIVYILYIILFRFTINWDFILVFIGLAVLMIWQVISAIVQYKIRMLPHRIYYMISIALLLCISVFVYIANNTMYTKGVVIFGATIAAYYFIIAWLDFFYKPNHIILR
jgi:O-antigen/teichoic acid export membrane protein